MAAPSGIPVPPIPPAPPAPPASDAPVTRRSQVVVFALLLLVAGLIGWRWYADHYRTRPADRHQEPGHRVDLNRATKSELMQIPGVGPQLADRIVAHRETAGRFNRVEDLDGVYGIGGPTLDRLRPWLMVHPADEKPPPPPEPDLLTRKPAPTRHVVQKPSLPDQLVNVNTATLEELDGLPGIGPVLAERIIAERGRKPFASVDDLRRVSGIGPKKLDAIRGLVTVGE